MKRRILHKINLTEISAVDNPAQEHARMVIMKRVDPNDTRRTRQEEPTMSFDSEVTKIMKRDSVTRSVAMTRARREHPDAWDAYRSGDVAKSAGNDFEALVKAEMHRGCLSFEVAAQQTRRCRSRLPS
jgi:hypothetical protein